MIGIETGDDDVLSFVNKGYTAQDILDAGKKMDEARHYLPHDLSRGLAGKGKLVEKC